MRRNRFATIPDYKNYVSNESREAFLLTANDEVAGYILINEATIKQSTEWSIVEFFIRKKFQGKGIATQAAYKIWQKKSPAWEVAVIPENRAALQFWEKTIAQYTNNQYKKENRLVDFGANQL